jgi:2-amino-4-hydroxy-6-hydroxymethyldihydropteridine diphosphokinase
LSTCLPLRAPVTAYVGLGANLGEPAVALLLAIRQLGSLPGITVTAQSSHYRTAPIDSGGPDYTNAVIAVDTTLTAPALLTCLQAVESAAGRQRPYRNAPRTLDLDILLYGDATISSATLSIPHPRMWQRAFVLLPLAELAPKLVSSVQLRTVIAQGVSRLP